MPAAEPEPFELGVNHWPAETAMGWLQAYDPALTRRDFVRFAAAGLDGVRVFVRWEDAQPAADVLDQDVLRRLVDVADAAAESGLALTVTLFVGHMSGVNWIPSWAIGGTDGDARFRVVSGGSVRPGMTLRNWYSDPAIGEAQERLAAGVAGALSGHPGVGGWDLGNESSNCTVPRDRGAGEAWLERITGAIHAHDPGRPVTIGIHMEDIEQDRMIGPAEAARWCDVVSMHGYPIYADWSAGPTDDLLLPFLAEITRWLAGGAPVLFQELGLPTTRVLRTAASPMCVTEEEAAAYVGRALDGLRAAGCVGAQLWCSSDYVARLFAGPPLDAAPHERTFGLWRADGTAKPAVAELTRRAGFPRVPAQPPGAWLDIDPETFACDRRSHLARLYRRYRALRQDAPAADAV